MTNQPAPARGFGWWPFAILTLACTLYFDTFTHEFSYDDLDVILKNDAIRDVSNLSALFSPERYFEVAVEASYRPMVTLMYLIESAVFGTNPVGFHAVGILIHGFCCVLIAWIGLRLGLERSLAFLASALFLSHPVATEVVNGVGFAEDLLALFFMLLSMTITLARTDGRASQITCAALLYLLAMLSKEVSVLFPVVVWTLLRRRNWSPSAKARLMGAMGTALAIYVYLRFFLFVLPPDLESLYKPSALPPNVTALTMSVIAANYIRLFFVPIGLSASHNVVVFDRINWVVVAAILVLVGFAILFVRSRRFFVRLGGLWCLLFLLPVSQVVATAQPLSERFLYVPLFGAVLAFVSAWDMQFGHSRFWKIWVPGLIVVVLSILTWQRNPVWRTQETLFNDAVRKVQNNSFALNSLGADAFDLGLDPVAEFYFKQAVAAQPDNYHYMNNLATLYFRMQRYREAIPILQVMMSIHPDDGNSLLKLAWSYWFAGEYERCRRQVENVRRARLRDKRDQVSLRDLEGRLSAQADTTSTRSTPDSRR